MKVIRRFLSEFLLYICNHIISNVPSHSLRIMFYKLFMKFKIESGSTVLLGCSFDAKNNFAIGINSVINANCRIDTRGGVTIGNSVSVSNDVIFLTADHDMNTSDFSGRTKGIIIEDYVWIGTRALIMPGVTIEHHAVVAAGAVVTKNVGSYEVVAGIPAKIIRYRDREQSYHYSNSYKRLFH